MRTPFPTRFLRHHLAGACLALAASAGHTANVVPPGTQADGSCLGQCGTSALQGDLQASPLAHSQVGFVSTAGAAVYGVSPLQLDSNSRGNGSENNGSAWRSGSFNANAGDPLNLQFNYFSTDGKGYDDHAWARLLNASDLSLVAWVFTARSSNSGTKGIVPGDVVDKSAFDPKNTLLNYDDHDFNSQDASDPVNWAMLGASNQSCWSDNANGCGYTGWLHSRHSFTAGGPYVLEVGVVNWGDTAYDSALAFDFQGLTSAVPEPSTALTLWGGLASLAFLARRRRQR